MPRKKCPAWPGGQKKGTFIPRHQCPGGQSCLGNECPGGGGDNFSRGTAMPPSL